MRRVRPAWGVGARRRGVRGALLGLGLAVAAAAQAADGSGAASAPDPAVVCSDAWYRSIEAAVSTGDGEGHGPDVASDEWKSVVEFKLGIRGRPDVPERDGEAWCRHIDRIVRSRRAASTAGPSFACDAVEAGSIEAVVCGDAELSALDRQLASAYSAARAKATNEHPPVLAAEQRGWIKGRDECWKSDDRRGCIRDEYVHRIAELQARYRLVPPTGPIFFVCSDNPADEVVVTYFPTEPPTLIAERGDSVSLMYQQPSGSGTRYQGRNESLWEHQGEVVVVWGHGAPEMRCKKAP